MKNWLLFLYSIVTVSGVSWYISAGLSDEQILISSVVAVVVLVFLVLIKALDDNLGWYFFVMSGSSLGLVTGMIGYSFLVYLLAVPMLVALTAKFLYDRSKGKS